MASKLDDLALGKCPHCDTVTTFIPTKKTTIYICDYCESKVRQHVNGKVHWYKFSEVPLGKFD